MKPPRFRNLVLGAGLFASLVIIASAASDKRRDRSPTASATAPTTTAISPAESFDAFQVIVERNIFNPNRVGRIRAVPEEKPPRIDEISLVGTMQYDKGLVAFFDSPDAAFRKTLREGESVADFKVQRIGADGVELLRGDQPIALKVTQQLRRPEGGEWTVRTTPTAAAPTSTTPGASSAPSPDSAPTEIPADASEVLKRLLKQREKQLNK